MKPLRNITTPRTPHPSVTYTLTLAHIITLLALGTLRNFAQAQAPDQTPAPSITKPTSSDPHTRIIQQSIALMEQSKWQQTLNLLNPLIQQNKTTGLKKHGAKFATAYYYKGLCLLKLAQIKTKEKSPQAQQTAKTHYQNAITSLNQCYTINPPNDNTNTYRIKSLLLRGNAQQALGQYQLAIHSYQLFLHQRNSALDPYNLSDFNINLAICLWKQPQTTPQQKTKATQQAITLLNQSILHTGRNKPSPRATLTALRTLTHIAIATQDDALIPTTIQNTHTTSPANLIIPPASTPQLLPTLSQLIISTAQKNLPQTSLHLTTLIPAIHQHANELTLPNINTPKPPITKTTTPLTQATKNATAIALQARAITLQKNTTTHQTQTQTQTQTHPQHQSPLAQALTLYTTIIDKYPHTPHQPENLYNLTRLAAQTEHTTTAITRAQQLLTHHPHHPLTTPTRTILLNTLYHTQQYQKSLTLAQKILTNLNTTPSPTPAQLAQKDTASFIRAASHYYLGNFTTAAPLLAHHHTTHPLSPHTTDTAYLTAAVQNQLHHWDTSIPALQKFITNHTPPTNHTPSIYTPFARYNIAYAHYSQRHLHTTILTLLPFTLDIPFVNTTQHQLNTQSKISPSAAILLGNTHQLLHQPDTAVTHYQHAIQLATDTNNTTARDEAYYLLIDLLGQPTWQGLTNHRLQETIPYYLHTLTLENAHTSPYHTQTLTAAITAIHKANPNNPQLPAHLLAHHLFIHNNTPNTPGIETALKTYLYHLRKYHHKKTKTTTQDIIHTLTKKTKTTPSPYHQALLIIAQIQTLEIAKQRTPQPQQKTNLQQQINQHYQNLITQHRTQDLDNFTLLKIAKHLTHTNHTPEAATYHQAILNSNSTIKQTQARLALAIQLASSNHPTQKQQAKQQLTHILNNPLTPPAPRATAHYHILQLLLQDQNWPQIETNALAYLKYPLNTKTHHLETLQLLARAYDQQQKINPAITTYTHIWVTTLFNIPNSAPAIHRACQLLWHRNNPATPGINQGKSDRQLAYETAYKYIRKTKNHLAQHKKNLPKKTLQTWQTIKTNATKTYPKADPTIKPFHGNP